MDEKIDEKMYSDNAMTTTDIDPKNASNTEMSTNNVAGIDTNEESGEEKKEDEEDDEEEEDEEEDRIIEKSPNLRFHKRNKKYMRKVPGIDNSFIAIEPKSGKEVIWNEVNFSDKKTEQENRFMNLIKKLKKFNHPFFVRYLEVWTAKGELNNRKVIFVTERLTDPTMKQYFVNSSSTNRLTNKALWKKFVGELMSVLKFLNHLGVSHGNLSNETVYYQNTGCLKVGTLAVDLNFVKDSSNDIYDMGKLALELAAYEVSDDTANLSPKERTSKMLSRVNDPQQVNFIDTCLASSQSPTTILKLFQHPVLREVPSLKRLAATVVVSSYYHDDVREERGEKNENQLTSGITTILKDQVSHYEDDTVLLRVQFRKENVIKLKLWKEFRANFTSVTKYLEDVKNGFYPIFKGKGCASNDIQEEVTYSYSEMEYNDNDKDNTLDRIERKIEDHVKDGQSQTPFTDIKAGPNTDKQVAISKDVNLQIESKGTEPGVLKTVSVDEKKTDASENKTLREGVNSYENDDDDDEYDEEYEEDGVCMEGNGVGQGGMSSASTGGGAGSPNSIGAGSSSSHQHGQQQGIYWDYVEAPDRPPSDRALFTGCFYSYLGCGRWQIYVQIWFLEDRLKREVIVQLSERDWARDSRIAELFERGHLIPAQDKPVLERILILARHNCPLIDGELRAPQKEMAGFDAYDLYQRLEHLQMFTKARQLLELGEQRRSSQNAAAPFVSAAQSTPGTSVVDSSATCSSGGSPSGVEVPNPTLGHGSTSTPAESLIGSKQQTHPQTSSNMPSQSAVSGVSTDIHKKHIPNDTSVDEKPQILKGLKIGDLPGFKLDMMDIRFLAPLNFSCMYCDNHDYLHKDLPPYLTSPCYHCRENFADEAKIQPYVLFDLHQQNSIPWPAFLQVRLNIPAVKQNGGDEDNVNLAINPSEALWHKTLGELIDYDCKWRGRSPCRCVPGLVLPPCVEFPNLYINMGGTSQSPSLIEKSNTNSTSFSKAISPSILPCSTRHTRGAQMTCFHGKTFPCLQQPAVTSNITVSPLIGTPVSLTTATITAVSHNVPQTQTNAGLGSGTSGGKR